MARITVETATQVFNFVLVEFFIYCFSDFFDNMFFLYDVVSKSELFANDEDDAVSVHIEFDKFQDVLFIKKANPDIYRKAFSFCKKISFTVYNGTCTINAMHFWDMDFEDMEATEFVIRNIDEDAAKPFETHELFHYEDLSKALEAQGTFDAAMADLTARFAN